MADLGYTFVEYGRCSSKMGETKCIKWFGGSRCRATLQSRSARLENPSIHY